MLARAAAATLLAAMGAAHSIAAGPQTRTISLYNVHTHESLTVAYKKGGKHIAAAMDRIDWVLRDWRKNEKTRMDPELIDLLWEVHRELGSSQPIHIISGYRSRATNEMLRKSVGGQATESRHILGKAADVYFPDVTLKKIRYSALVRERGGVGYYPNSATPFVHIDTDRVRHWPRLPREELALLFPSGRTQHVPADGTPISPADARVAKAHHKDFAFEVAALQERRKRLKPSALLADAGSLAPGEARRSALGSKVALTPTVGEPWLVPTPRLVADSRLADGPWRLTAAPTEEEKQKLGQLAALASQRTMEADPASVSRRGSKPIATLQRRGATAAGLVGRPMGAPDRAPRVPIVEPKHMAALPDRLDAANSGSAFGTTFDEAQFEEFAYRPFPVAPYMTATASPDDPALGRMVHHDTAITLQLLDRAGDMPSVKLRPGQRPTRLSWAQQFEGEAAAFDTLFDASATAPEAGRSDRRLRTSAPSATAPRS
jgi:uncharacterized protein YcbK (DUF882 family)